MKILVSGGAGFIGSNLTEYLITKGHEVFVVDKLLYAGRLDNFSNSTKNSKRFFFFRNDIGNTKVVSKLLKKVDAVIHLAARTHIDRSILNIYPFIKDDFISSAKLLETIKDSKFKGRVIFISTSEVYGSAQNLPMTEAHPLAPQSPYAATKLAAEQLAYSFYKTFGINLVILRLFNQYGPRQYPEKLIPFFITNILSKLPVYIYGSGEAKRDWVYVSDGIKAIEKALKTKENGYVINIGTGKSYSIMEILDLLSLELGIKPLIKKIKDRPGHVYNLQSSQELAKEKLNWEAEIFIKEGIKKTVKWYKEHEKWWVKRRETKAFKEHFRRWYNER